VSGSAGGDTARRGQLVGAALLAAMVIVGALIAFGAFGGDDPAQDASLVEGVRGVEETSALLDGVPQKGIVLGDPEAPVTIVEFADLKCSSCRGFVLEHQPTIVRDLVRTGKANVELRLLALKQFGEDGRQGRTAAHNLAATNQLWPLAELAFYNQGPSSQPWIDAALLRGFAKASPELRGARIDLRPTAASRQYDAAADRLAKDLDLKGTPTIYVRPADDPRPEAFERVDVARFEDPATAIADAVAGLQSR
jgi:protein-disulfide isomerase